MVNRHVLWDVDALAFDDIPTVQELFRSADDKRLSALVVDLWLKEDRRIGASRKRIRRMRKRARQTLRDMEHLDVAASSEWCLFPERSFGADLGKDSLSVDMGCVLVRRGDFERAAYELERRAPIVSRGEWRARVREHVLFWEEECAAVQHNAVLSTYVYSFEPWESLLGFRMWLGGDFTRKERYHALADLFVEATRFDVTEHAVAEGVDQELQSLAEIDDDTRAAPAAVVLARLGMGEYGLEGSTDDFDQEHARGMMDLACALNHNAHLDTCRRVADLSRKLERGGHRGRQQQREAEGALPSPDARRGNGC